MRSNPQQQQMAALRANNKNIRGLANFNRIRVLCPKILSPAQTRPARLSEIRPVNPALQIHRSYKFKIYNNTACRLRRHFQGLQHPVESPLPEQFRQPPGIRRFSRQLFRRKFARQIILQPHQLQVALHGFRRNAQRFAQFFRLHLVQPRKQLQPPSQTGSTNRRRSSARLRARRECCPRCRPSEPASPQSAPAPRRSWRAPVPASKSASLLSFGFNNPTAAKPTA